MRNHYLAINNEHMKTTLLISFFLFTGILASAQLPFNPDVDGDEMVLTPDFLEFVSLYGQPFESDEVVPVLNGGTGSSTPWQAKDSLLLSFFGDSVMTIGNQPTAVGWVNGRLRVTNSIIEGFQTTASGLYAHGEGYSTTASGNFSHSQNRFTVASGICSHAEGEGSTATATAVHAEGFQSTATATAAHAEGYETQAIGPFSHASNRNTVADGICAHAEGESTSALADAAHSEGYFTQATGFASHSEGTNTIASGTASSASGTFTRADQNNQTAIGQYNLLDQTGAMFTVGIGTSEANRNDAFQVYNSGLVAVPDTLQVGNQLNVQGQDILQLILDLQASNAALQSQIQLLQEQIDILNGQ